MFASMIGTTLLTTALTALVIATPAPSASQSAAIQQAVQTANWQTLQPKTYTVKPGDSLGSIAQQVYGDSNDWITLWNDNSWIENPNQLYSDWHLTIRTTAPDVKDNVLSAQLQAKLAPKPTVSPIATATPSVTPESTPTAAQSATPEASASATPTATASPAASADQGSSPYDAVYQAAGAKFGVPWQILYGIHMTETGGRNGDIMNHSGSGAEGPMQFMPGTFKAYAQDGDGDGKADIANAVDAIYTAANYLAQHGSLANGLRSYGGNTARTLELARERGWDGSL